MKIDSAFNSALNGIRRGSEGLDRNAAEIASASGNGEKPLTAPLVESKVHLRQVEAGVEVLRTADEMVGTLLDEEA